MCRLTWSTYERLLCNDILRRMELRTNRKKNRNLKTEDIT